MSDRRRLLTFCTGILLVFLALELLVRFNATAFEAATSTGLAKAALCEKRPRVDMLFLGTSRTQDGVSPGLMTRAFSEMGPGHPEWEGFNVAFSGASLGDLMALGPRLSSRGGLKVAVIEVSEPQIQNRPPAWERLADPPPGIEGKLESWVKAVRLIRYRSAFLPDNIGRLPAMILFSGSLEGWETKGIDQVASWLGFKPKPATGFVPGLWSPPVIAPAQTAVRLAPDLEEVATRYADLARGFRAHGVRVVLAVPPLAKDLRSAPERGALKPFLAEVARRSECELWDYAALDLPDGLFKNSSHLGREGRAHFSKALAIQIAAKFGQGEGK